MRKAFSSQRKEQKTKTCDNKPARRATSSNPFIASPPSNSSLLCRTDFHKPRDLGYGTSREHSELKGVYIQAIHTRQHRTPPPQQPDTFSWWRSHERLSTTTFHKLHTTNHKAALEYSSVLEYFLEVTRPWAGSPEPKTNKRPYNIKQHSDNGCRYEAKGHQMEWKVA